MIIRQEEKGFVLATSLVMLLLMTMLTATVYFGVNASQKSSLAAESSTEAFYYAETAANYISWALANDVEFDSYTYPQAVRTGAADNFTFGEPSPRDTLPDPSSVGDYAEWDANRGNPYGFNAVDGVGGQLMYYDNTSLSSRAVSFQGGSIFSSSDYGVTAAVAQNPELFEIHKKLPRFVRLDIDVNGNITPAMPPYDAAAPHHGNTMGIDYPENGALVWLTGGNKDDDFRVAPVDNYTQAIYVPDDVGGMTYDPYEFYDNLDGTPGDDSYYNCGLDVYSMQGSFAQACNMGTGSWLQTGDYGLVIYALGYVNGKAKKLIRVVYVNANL